MVSIIIPTYNNGRFLAAALNSVLAQGYPSYEMIVIDDGSTDDTQSILRPFQKQINYIYQENMGSAAARNAGLGLAQGEFIVFLDADDLLLPQKLQIQVDYLLQNPSLGMVHSGWCLIDEKGAQVAEVTPWEKAPVLDLEAWLWKKPIKMGAMMYRKHWLRYVNGFDPDLRQSQDTDLMIRLALAGCTAEWIKQPTMAYRVHPTSTIRRNAVDQYKYVLQVLEKAFAHPNMPDDLKLKKERMEYFSLRWSIWHIFEAGFPKGIIEPLKILVMISPYNQLDTLFDIVFYLAKKLIDNDRSLTDLQVIKSTLLLTLNCHETDWRQVERLIQVLFTDLYALNDEEPHTVWSFWQTAVLREEESQLSAEHQLLFWLSIWRPYLSQQQPLPQTLDFTLPPLSPAGFSAIGRLCLAENTERYSMGEIREIWQYSVSTGFVPAEYGEGYVSWCLTIFGQTVLRREWVVAGKALMQAVKNTIVAPANLSAWQNFFQTAAAYYRQK